MENLEKRKNMMRARKLIKKYVRKLARTSLGIETKYSRRYSGQYSYEQSETNGFKRVFCYIQKGITIDLKDLITILTPIIDIEIPYCCRKENLNLKILSFGWEDDELKISEEKIVYGMVSPVPRVTKIILDISKSESVGTTYITTLIPEDFSITRRDKKETLFLFISNDNILFSDEYIKDNKFIFDIVSKRSIHIKVVDGKIEVELGIFNNMS